MERIVKAQCTEVTWCDFTFPIICKYCGYCVGFKMWAAELTEVELTEFAYW